MGGVYEELEAIREEIEEIQEETIVELSDKIDTLESNLGSLSSQVSSLASGLSSLQNTVTSRATRISNLENQVGAGGSVRPVTPYLYQVFFDSNLGQPIWWSGANWVDSEGNIV